MAIYLKRVSDTDKSDRRLYEMLQQIESNENGFHNSGYGLTWEQFPAYIEKLLKNISAPDLAKGLVPQTVWWLFDGEEVVGYAKMRHFLTDRLRLDGGHIGYGIRKDRRRQGYGREILRLTLQEIKKIGVTRALLTCHTDNLGSQKIIEANHGRLEKQANGHNYYWIENF